jgi:hypothetical protein
VRLNDSRMTESGDDSYSTNPMGGGENALGHLGRRRYQSTVGPLTRIGRIVVVQKKQNASPTTSDPSLELNEQRPATMVFCFVLYGF